MDTSTDSICYTNSYEANANLMMSKIQQIHFILFLDYFEYQRESKLDKIFFEPNELKKLKQNSREIKRSTIIVLSD